MVLLNIYVVLLSRKHKILVQHIVVSIYNPDYKILINLICF